MSTAKYIGRVGALAVALGVGITLASTPAVAFAEPANSDTSLSDSSPSKPPASGAISADSSSTGLSTSTNDPPDRHQSRVPRRSPLNRSFAMAVRSSGGANTTAPTGSPPAQTGAATAASGAPAPFATAWGVSGSRAAKNTRTSVAAQRHADDRTAPASTVDAARVVANAVPTPTATKPAVLAASTTRLTTAARHVAPDVSESPLPAPAKTSTATVPTPIETVSEMTSGVVDAVVSPLAAGTAPGTPAPTPALWTLAAFARRELEQAFAISSRRVNGVASPTTNGLVIDTEPLTGQAVEAAVTGLTGAPAGVSVLPAGPQLNATAVAATFSGQPSIVSRVVTAALRVLSVIPDALGVDIITPIGRLMASDRPPWFTTLGLNVQRSTFDGWAVYELAPANPSGKYVVAVHGGEYILQPTILFHWVSYAAMARDTGATVVVPIYPLAPQGTAGTVVPQMADLISARIDQHGAENVSVYGDSAGGAIALSAVQELVRRDDPVPSRMVLISPALDLTLSNPAIPSIDDPFLPPVAILRKYIQLWAGDLALTDPLVSPLYGSLAGLPPTAVYFGNLDVLSPDVLVLQDKTLAQGSDFTFILRNGELHGWPGMWFLPEAQAVLPDIYRQLGLDAEADRSETFRAST